VSHRALIVSAALVVCGACDATGPDDTSLEVRIVATAEPPVTTRESDGSLVIECAVHVSATALGSGATAIWDGAVLRWYAGPDRVTPFHVDTLSSEDVAGLWGSDRLVDTLSSDWRMFASAPFIAGLEFFFRVNGSGQRRSSSTSAACGIDPAAPTPAPPTVSGVEIRTPSPFEPGDTLVVSYSANAPGRLFGTAVVIEGAWEHTERVAEHLVNESNREVRLTIPPGVTLGSTLDIAVLAVDALGQTNAPVWAQTASLVDVTPPDFVEPPRLVGQYGVGDTIPISFHVRDNHALRDLIVEIGGESWTFPLDGHQTITYSSVTAEATWLGAPGLAVSVTDAGGLVTRREAHPDSFRVFPVVDRPRVSWTGPDRYRSAAWDDANDRLYLTFTEPLAVGGIDRRLELFTVSTATMSTLRSHTLPAPAVSVDFTTGGDTAVVSLDRGTLAIVDVQADLVTELQLSPGVWQRAGNLTVLADGRALVELVESGGPPYLALVDITDGTVLWKKQLDRIDVALARTRDRSVVGVRSSTGCMMVYTAATETLSACLPGIGIPNGVLNADATGSRFLSAEYLIDVPTASFRTAWGMREDRVPVSAFAPDDMTLYRSDGAGLTHIRISDGVALERFPFPVAGDLLISADGSTLIAPCNAVSSTSQPVIVERVMLR
jgi:hypothetical protein